MRAIQMLAASNSILVLLCQPQIILINSTKQILNRVIESISQAKIEICPLGESNRQQQEIGKVEFIYLSIDIYSLQQYFESHLMEGAVVGLFWGSMLAQYIWLQRQPIYNHTKNFVKNAAKAIWERSITKIKSLRQKKSVTFKDGQDEEPLNSESISHILNQEKEEKNGINKQKKIKKQRFRPPRNLRRTMKRYEDWFLENRNLRRMTKKIEKPDRSRQDSSFQFKQQSCDFNDNLVNYNIEQLYEQYCEENDDQYNNGTILGYNPIVSDHEEQNDNCLNSYTERTSR